MSVSDYFSTFCSNLRMDSDTVSTIQYRYHQITKRINLDYWNSSSETTHSLYVGSYGRGTEIYIKNFDLSGIAQEHKKASDLLWKIREEYVSLLTDFEMLDSNNIRNKRDELQERTSEVYSNSPRTDAKSYTAAQKALKTEEEQTFSEAEIDIMLPNSIRRCNRQMVD